MENLTVAIGFSSCGESPIMPYIGQKIVGADVAGTARLHLQAALLRCGIDIIDISAPIADPQEIATPVFRHKADAAIVLSLAAFGSRRSFNDVHGCVTRCAQGRFFPQSRTLCEDICAKLHMMCDCTAVSGGESCGANCKACTVDIGHLTCFDDARKCCDPDYITATAEHIAMGICENLSVPYTMREDISCYPVMSGSAIGQRGKKIKQLQTLLSAHGYKLIPDGIFGKNTELALKMFCINNDVTDGGLSEALFNKLLGLRRDGVHVGSKSADAEYINAKLRAKLYNAPARNEFTLDSLSALNEFLSEAGKPTLSPTDVFYTDELPELTKIGGGRPRLI